MHIILNAVHCKPKPRRGSDLPNGSTEAELIASGLMKVKTKEQIG